MKKTAIIFTLILCLTLCACSAKPPEKTVDGTAWGTDWTTVGNYMGMEPMDGWTVQRNEDVLAAEGTFYTAWVQGEEYTYTNEDGDEITTYDAQIHLVVVELNTPNDAEQTAAQWQELTEERYPGTEETLFKHVRPRKNLCNRQSMTV